MWGGSLRPASLQGTKVPICGWSAEGRGIGPKSSPQCRSPACSSQMAGYNAETGRSSNENICCELQNKTQTPNSPNRREDSFGFCLEGGEVGSWRVGADGQRMRSSHEHVRLGSHQQPWTGAESRVWTSGSVLGSDPQKALGHPAARIKDQTPTPTAALPTSGPGTPRQGCFTSPTESAPCAPQGSLKLPPKPPALGLAQTSPGTSSSGSKLQGRSL